MSYEVLARKWRPHTMNDMVGQEPILRMLSNALSQQRLHHAYLFTGTRGVGKTTLARIFAKCLNCESGITPTPCDTCAICVAIDAGQFLDLYEIDAASRTKVEDTRELLENIAYPPTQGRFKIYLIDEVHMLSNHSFNALLKTLEEPPAHVKFLLATTDPKRLPITILSRCLQFHLKRITPAQIAKHLQDVCTAEHINYEAPALEKLAHAADGSMRDALSLLDQAIAYGKAKVTHDDVNAMLSSTSQEDLLPLVEALAKLDGQGVFYAIKILAERAPDFTQLLDELLQLFHRLAISQLVPQAFPNDACLEKLIPLFTPEDVQLYYQIALLGKRDIAFTPNPQQGFEMTLLRMLALKPIIPNITVIPSAHTVIPSATRDPLPNREIPRVARDDNNTRDDKDTQDERGTWREILPKLELSGMAYALAANCMLEKIEGSQVTLALAANHEPMLNPKLKERLAEALSRHLNQQTISLEIVLTAAPLATPAKEYQQEQKEQLAQATEAVMQNPKVKKLIDLYDATVEVQLNYK